MGGWKAYLQLTKPGIVMGNGMTAMAGFALASRRLSQFDGLLFLAMLGGILLIVASSCVLNNYFDRIADQKMARTRNRALATGSIEREKALAFAGILAGGGVCLLGFLTNALALEVALCGMLIYLALYTPLKYRTRHAALVGSFAGAVPPVVGYAAMAYRLDLGAFLLFFLLILWQMPHFFAISLYRIQEFQAASIPVFPLQRGVRATKTQMLLYIIAFLLAASLLTFYGFTGFFYLIISLGFGLAWLVLAFRGFWVEQEKKWARRMFLFSTQVITVLSLLLAIDGKSR